MELNPPTDRSNPENGRLINNGQLKSGPGLNLTEKGNTDITPLYRFPLEIGKLTKKDVPNQDKVENL